MCLLCRLFAPRVRSTSANRGWERRWWVYATVYQQPRDPDSESALIIFTLKTENCMSSMYIYIPHSYTYYWTLNAFWNHGHVTNNGWPVNNVYNLIALRRDRGDRRRHAMGQIRKRPPVMTDDRHPRPLPWQSRHRPFLQHHTFVRGAISVRFIHLSGNGKGPRTHLIK